MLPELSGDVEGRHSSPHFSSSWQGLMRFLKAVQDVKDRDPKEESPTSMENAVLIHAIRNKHLESQFTAFLL